MPNCTRSFVHTAMSDKETTCTLILSASANLQPHPDVLPVPVEKGLT